MCVFFCHFLTIEFFVDPDAEFTCDACKDKIHPHPNNVVQYIMDEFVSGFPASTRWHIHCEVRVVIDAATPVKTIAYIEATVDPNIIIYDFMGMIRRKLSDPDQYDPRALSMHMNHIETRALKPIEFGKVSSASLHPRYKRMSEYPELNTGDYKITIYYAYKEQ